MIRTVEGFGIVNKAEIDVFLECSCFFDDPVDVGNLISGCSAFSKTSFNIWNFMVHVLLKPGLENFDQAEACWLPQTAQKHGPEELPLAQGQGWQPRAPGCDSAGVAQRRFPTSEVRGGCREELPHV